LQVTTVMNVVVTSAGASGCSITRLQLVAW
jgi:hypothetical protein